MKEKMLKPLREKQIITVGSQGSDIAGFDSHAIQKAVNALTAAEGGIVQLSEGSFEIYGPVRLKDNITLSGSGYNTVLRKVSGYKVRLAEDADYGELKVTVEDAGGFRTGMGIQVTDSLNIDCWSVTTAVITSISGNTIYIDNSLQRDYGSELDGSISNACSIIEAVDASGVSVTNLLIAGGKADNQPVDGCRGGGIYFHRSADCSVENVKVTDFNGDGISWQITETVTIRNCEVSGCTNYGLHPGTGSLDTFIEGCDIHDNGSDGIFVCWRVQQSHIRNNLLHRNQGNGINIGHKDTDNLIENNHIFDNRDNGILFREESLKNGAHRNTIRQNMIENNGNGSAGCGILINSFASGIVIESNIIRDSGNGLQKTGILICAPVPGIKLECNRMSGHLGGDTIYSFETGTDSIEGSNDPH